MEDNIQQSKLNDELCKHNESTNHLLQQIQILEEIVDSTNISERIFSNIKKFQQEEYQYLNLLENILENGIWEEGRNGKTKSIFGASMRFSLKDGTIPILTTKKNCLENLFKGTFMVHSW
jgi:hypothetical protein